MKWNLNKGFFLLYLGVLVPLILVGAYQDGHFLIYLFKPLLIPVVTGWFYYATTRTTTAFKRPVYLALFFSWLGDLALMFDHLYSWMFLVGLGSFLLAHVNYIWVFLKHRSEFNSLPKLTWFVVLLLGAYTAILLQVLWPSLADLSMPVLVYALVLFLMSVTSVIRQQKIGFYWVALGAILFVISDSILALNKFNAPIEFAQVWVMLTYSFAQLFIVLGLSKSINSEY